MAIREVREIGDDILTKPCKPVPKLTIRTRILIRSEERRVGKEC